MLGRATAAVSRGLACCHQPHTDTGGPTAFYSTDCWESILVSRAAPLTKLTTHVYQSRNQENVQEGAFSRSRTALRAPRHMYLHTG
jgi:hypothetical protein